MKNLPLLRLIRFELPLAAGVTALMGAALAQGDLPAALILIPAFLSVFCIAASTLVLNDVFDLEVDRVNAPDRPLPSGAVSPQAAVALFAALSIFGLALSAFLGTAALLTAALAWVLGLLYNARWKRSGLPGNLTVAVCTGLLFVYGGMAAGRPFEGRVWFFALTALLIDLAEEIAGDAFDMEGDRLIGSRSLALTHGRQFALNVSAALFALLTVLSMVPFLTGWLAPAFLPVMLAVDGVMLYAAAKLRSPSTRDPKRFLLWVPLALLAAMLLYLLLTALG